MMVQPYREVPSAIVVVRPKHSTARINNGVLRRAVACPVPGPMARWWHNIHKGDVWECACGQAWTYTGRTYVEPWERVATQPESAE